MADISTHTGNIQRASRGEAVRDSIINAAKAMDEQGTNANTLNGHPAEDFVTTSDIQKAMADSGNILDKINNKVVNGGINNKINESLKAKNNIANAIINKGVKMDKDLKLDEYPDKILQVSGVNNPGSLYAVQEGTYYAEGDGYDAYTEVSVNVTEGLQDITISEEGSFMPEEGYSGFKTVTVSVPGGGGPGSGPYNVTFMSETGDILQVISNIPYGGDATYTGPTPTKEDLVFNGWDPSPYNIKGDTYCYPVFIDSDTQYSGEIVDSWDDIIAHPENYKIGSYKTLDFVQSDVILSVSNLKTYTKMSATSCVMEKIYEGESGTKSTWMCKTLPSLIELNGTGKVSFYPEGIEPDVDAIYGWVDSEHIKTYRTWLNREFPKLLPQNLRRAIKAVPKYTLIFDPQGFQYVRNNMTLDKIWAPSKRELYLEGEDTQVIDMEELGVTYTGYYNTKDKRMKKSGSSIDAFYLRSVGVGKHLCVINLENIFAVSCLYQTITEASGPSVSNKICFGFCL